MKYLQGGQHGLSAPDVRTGNTLKVARNVVLATDSVVNFFEKYTFIINPKTLADLTKPFLTAKTITLNPLNAFVNWEKPAQFTLKYVNGKFPEGTTKATLILLEATDIIDEDHFKLAETWFDANGKTALISESLFKSVGKLTLSEDKKQITVEVEPTETLQLADLVQPTFTTEMTDLGATEYTISEATLLTEPMCTFGTDEGL